MSYFEVNITALQNNVDEISDYLLEIGAISASIENVQNTEQKVVAYFNNSNLNNSDKNNILENIKNNFLEKIIDLSTSILREQNWQETWKQHFNPLYFNNKLAIIPSWHENTENNIPNIILDPGMAFGTGNHATTLLCLEWLADNLKPNSTVIDFGTGSGILALAAMKLKAKKVYGIDIDQLSVTVAKENAAKNNLNNSDLIFMHTDDFEKNYQNLKADVVIANILAEPLTELAPLLCNLLNTNGNLILSGVLDRQKDIILNCYKKFNINFSVKEKDGWLIFFN